MMLRIGRLSALDIVYKYLVWYLGKSLESIR